MNVQRTLRLIIDSSLDQVSLLGHALRGVLEREPGTAGDAALLELAVCEAVNNAIIHAYQREPGFPVEVTLTLADEGLAVSVADQGRVFADFPAELPGMPDGDDLAAMPLGGWGLRIIGQVMERVDYASDTERNVLTMWRAWG